MARPRASRASEQRGSVVPLVVAWLIVIAVLIAGGGLVAWQYDGSAPRLGKQISLALPPAPDIEEPEPEAETAEVTVDPAERESAEAAEQKPEAAPPSYDGPPRIAVVLTGLGLASEPTETAIDRLPAGITLSFSPYGEALDQWIPRARAMGHEVMIDLPMEPDSFPLDDPGPQALLTGKSPEENVQRLRWFLARGQDFAGVAMHMGSRFVQSRDELRPILSELQARGILFLDNGSSEASLAEQVAAEVSLPFAANDRTIDEGDPSREAINARLIQVERIALTEGTAVAMAQPYPVTLDRLANWAASLEARGFALVPVSTLAIPGPVRTAPTTAAPATGAAPTAAAVDTTAPATAAPAATAPATAAPATAAPAATAPAATAPAATAPAATVTDPVTPAGAPREQQAEESQ